MPLFRSNTSDAISKISTEACQHELELASSKYHKIAPWIAIIFNPLFAAIDYVNIPWSWKSLLVIRLSISIITVLTIVLAKKLKWRSYVVVAVPFVLISLQNAYTYSLINDEDVLGHNLNYMALIIGAALFLLWEWEYSVAIVCLSSVAVSFFISQNDELTIQQFFVKGGLIVLVASIFMVVLINTRFQLTVKEIKARLALQLSKEEVMAQAEEIKGINENLEALVTQRTIDLERKNKALEEYAFINAHKLRAPVASILGLINILNFNDLDDNSKVVLEHMLGSTKKLDEVVKSITMAIERADIE